MQRYTEPPSSRLPFVNTFLSFIGFFFLFFFLIRYHEKPIKRGQFSPQAAADFAREKKALKTTRVFVMGLVVFFVSLSVYLWT